MILPRITQATTIITNTRTEVAQMAGLWEADSVQISGLANSQYPQFGTNSWQFIFPHANISSDGDIHNDMAIDSSGTGSTGNNAAESPIIAEVINATSAQLSHEQSIKTHQVKSRGIFRVYTEHASERHFELHPVTEFDSWNGSAWVLDSDYHGNIVTDPNGTTHSGSTLQAMFTQNMTAQVMADNTNVILTFTSPNTNYGQFDGVAQSGVLNDPVSSYFWFIPTNPAVATTVRCRLITNTAAAFNATSLASNHVVTVNILTRWDMLAISNKIASLTANQSSSFAAPLEFITLSVSSTGIVSSLPVISNISVTNITNTTATIQWMTDVQSDSRVSYGTSPAGATNVVSVAGSVTNHVVNLTGLQPGTQYYYSVSSTSTGGTTTDDNQGAFYTFTTTALPTLQSIQTVFIILMENQNWASISGNAAAPYINHGLLPMASHAEQYFNPPAIHPSLPNYLWLEAGTNFGILADGDPSSFHQSTTNHLVTLLKNAGISWTSFQEDITGTTCPLTAVNQYAPKHNPMVYFDDVTNTNNTGSTYCISNVRPYTELATDLQSNVVTRYNFITPNLCDDMHGNTGCPGGSLITQGDTWLSNNIPIIMSSQAYSNNGAIFIVWDEGEGGDGPIGMIVLSPLAKGGGYSNTVHYTHSSTLRTLEEIFNVGPLLGDAANATDLGDLFAFGSAGQLSVSPSSGFTSAGSTGGPFSPVSQTYTLNNAGGATLSWTASKTATWLTLSATAGILAPASNATVTVSINANANSLAANSYSDTVSFTNTTNGAGNDTRAVSLTVTNGPALLSVTPASGLTSSGLVGGPFSPISQTYTLSNAGGATLSWTASNTANWLTLSTTSGTLGIGASTTVTASINANANSLSAGGYFDAVSFTNTTNDAGDTTRPVSLTISNRTPVLVANGSMLVSEGCTPTNGVIDPGEAVTVNFSIKNIGTGNTSNLVATLVATNGVTLPGGPQTYGVIAASGGTATEPFPFTAVGTCGGSITATLQLQDGVANFGTVTFTLPLGQTVAPLAENFDAVTAPTLPAGWSTSASGAESNWVTSTASADSLPNAAFSPDPGAVGINELDTPIVSVSSASAVLTFRQKYGLAASPTNSSVGLDGGVLEIKIGGGSYTDILAAGGSFVSGAYNATVISTNGNPLAGRQAWSGNSSGFVTTVVNLPPAAAGQNAQLRWLCGAGNVPSNSVSSSGTLAFWGFDASTPNADTAATNVAASSVAVVNTTGSLTYFGGNPSAGKAIASSGFTSTAGPPTTSYSYFSFSLTFTNGSLAGLSRLSFDDRASGTGPASFDVQISQVANFSSVIYDSGAHSTHQAFTNTPMNSFTLTNSGLTGTVYFRIYAYSASGSGGTWRLDNLNVQGSVAGSGGATGTGWYIDSVSINDTACCTNSTPPPPVASFTGSPTNGTEPLAVTFTDTSTGSITSRFWDFGDSGTTNVTTNSVSHVYAAGTYNITLIASGPGGSGTNTQLGYITVLTAFQAWQNQYFGSTTNSLAAAGADPFGKGISNTNQFLMGLNPTNPASTFRVISVAATGNDVVITWRTSGGDASGLFGSGKTNVLEVTSGLSGGSYSNNFASTGVTNVITTLGDVITNAVDAGGATNVPSRYYQIQFISP